MRRIAAILVLTTALVALVHLHPLSATAARLSSLPSAASAQPAPPDLTLTLSNGGAPLIPGRVMNFTLTYGNIGGSDAADVQIKMSVPNHTTFNPGASTPGWTCTPNNNAGSNCTFSIGTLPAGASGSSFFAATVNSSVTPGALVFVTAVISADETSGETNLSNNGAFVTAFAIYPPLIFATLPIVVEIGGAAQVQVIVTNADTITSFTLTEVSVNVMLSAGLRVADTPNAGGCSGTVSVSAMRDSLTMSGMTFGPGQTCTLGFDVTGVQVGEWGGTVSVASAETGAGTPAAFLNLAKVLRPLVLTKSFNPTAVPVGGVSAVTLTVTNPADNFGGGRASVGDLFPTGLTLHGDGNLSVTDCSYTSSNLPVEGIAVELTDLTPGSTCVITFDVTSATPGSIVNEARSGGAFLVPVSSASATLTVFAPPQVSTSFAPANIPAGGTTRFTLTITNPSVNPGNLLGVTLAGPFPSGLAVQGTGNLSTAGCIGGTITTSGGQLVLTGVSVAVGTPCVVSLDLTSTTPGVIATEWSVTSSNGGQSAPASATLTVVAPPRIAKAFSPAVVTLNQTSVLTITVTNPSPNTINLSGVGFTDSLPAGLVIHTTPNLSTTGCGTNASVSGSTISLSGATVAAGTPCVITVTVRATTGGLSTNMTSVVTSTNGGTGLTASATLTVDSTPPDLRLRFDPATRGVVVEAIDEGGSGLTTTGPLAPATCTTQRTGEQCLYRATDHAGNATTLTLLITRSSTSSTVRVVSVQYSGRVAATPLTHSAVYSFAPATGVLSSLTQTLTVVEGSTSRKVEARFPATGAPTSTQVTTTVGSSATTQTCPAQALLWLRTNRTASGVTLSIDSPCPL